MSTYARLSVGAITIKGRPDKVLDRLSVVEKARLSLFDYGLLLSRDVQKRVVEGTDSRLQQARSEEIKRRHTCTRNTIEHEDAVGPGMWTGANAARDGSLLAKQQHPPLYMYAFLFLNSGSIL